MRLDLIFGMSTGFCSALSFFGSFNPRFESSQKVNTVLVNSVRKFCQIHVGGYHQIYKRFDCFGVFLDVTIGSLS